MQIQILWTAKEGRTALHLTTVAGHRGPVELLCKYNIDIKIEDKFGETALYKAIMNNYHSIASMLETKFNVDPSSIIMKKNRHGQTLLYTMVIAKNHKMSQLLYNWGANPTICDGNSKTPSSIAVIRKYKHMSNEDFGK
ncbi:ankyrin repeat-containing domain protein [Jimgerdemannia flammicorona]|uniref:Ankyrin repeat-containing domain protein n=1 Tax=Jimgerdemannia flammicorona TaxID=994334 RepID=A0A433QTZ5_9FUNG|nr:ankyrin repeat-containing domain protein [Jimgerdemannia flammicorona]